MHITNKGSRCYTFTYIHSYVSVWLVLTNDVSPRDSQDNKIFPKHTKFNPKLNPFPITLKMKNKINEKCIWFI